MITAGIDIGSRASKAVILKDGKIISSYIGDTGAESVVTSKNTLAKTLEGCGLKIENLDYIVATGYGRVLVPFANENISEISCHARGVNYFFPSVRTILDMGGQDCKAISVDAAGVVTDFVMNDKCAGGTGRFLEMIADVLNVPLTDIGDLALQSRGAIPFNTICAVFARSEAVAYMRKGVSRSDILAGLNEAISIRCLNLLKKVSIKADFSISGGISKNKGMVAKIKEKAGLEPLLAPDPQLAGCLGAALFAMDRVEGKGKREEMKISYGYTDGTGDYYITLDSSKCDGCGKCVPACPSGVWEVGRNQHGQPKARVKEELRKKLHLVCPGFKACSTTHANNCHSACPNAAISHRW
ncbi:MAG TPA: acyl-CoA dehydratase activase [Dehalococcoidales bacterium]|nr:acyl-CoA dehydratase activase [Dehalococcoidales bacterium]